MGSYTPAGVPILDIRRDKSDMSLVEMLKQSLNPSKGQPRTFPTLLLYDEKGLKLFEDITYLDEYYLTNAEIETLTLHASELAARLPEGVRLVELGSGNLRKVNILLEAFEKAKKRADYFALDLSLPELKRTFAELDTEAFHFVKFHGLHGTYDDGLSWLEESRTDASATCVMTLGSSIGNFTRANAAQFLASFRKVLAAQDFVLVGLDACQRSERVFHAYNDSQNITRSFYRNGLVHANDILGYEAFNENDWTVEGLYDNSHNKHQASYVALKAIDGKDFTFEKGEKIHLEDAFKYAEAESDALWHAAGLIPQISYGNKAGDYYVHLLSPSSINFPVKPADFATNPIPSLNDWRQLWAAWDTVTRSMVPKDELMNKPIKLRNDLIFYLGHIPTFADIHIAKATAGKPTKPTSYWTIFERGIDPDVDNPELCHDHSEIPDSWPPLQEILNYCERVRTRIVDSIDSGHADNNRKLGRGLWLAYEHEAMHLETFIYMLLQSDKVLSPPGRDVPDFRLRALEAVEKRVENQWHHVPASQISIGLDDAENDLGPDRYFGWDNERPSRSVSVSEFEAQSRPISNGEYAWFVEISHKDTLPASWTISGASEQSNGSNVTNGVNGHENNVLKMASPTFLEGKAIRTVYGLVPLKYALDWPVMASYDELVAYAEWSDGRIPTLEEARSLYQYVEEMRGILQKVPSKLISAVNGHLSNEGVEETPPSSHLSNGAVNGCAKYSQPDPNELFIELEDRNVAFREWCPTPVTGNGNRLCGQSDLGGLWEWTSTALAPHDGFKAMDLYPGYTADFFDGKHNVCLGGSWATVPRIALKKTFVNWYQKNYPYVWCTARLVRDVHRSKL